MYLYPWMSWYVATSVLGHFGTWSHFGSFGFVTIHAFDRQTDGWTDAYRQDVAVVYNAAR